MAALPSSGTMRRRT